MNICIKLHIMPKLCSFPYIFEPFNFKESGYTFFARFVTQRMQNCKKIYWGIQVIFYFKLVQFLICNRYCLWCASAFNLEDKTMKNQYKLQKGTGLAPRITNAPKIDSVKQLNKVKQLNNAYISLLLCSAHFYNMLLRVAG